MSTTNKGDFLLLNANSSSTLASGTVASCCLPSVGEAYSILKVGCCRVNRQGLLQAAKDLTTPAFDQKVFRNAKDAIEALRKRGWIVLQFLS